MFPLQTFDFCWIARWVCIEQLSTEKNDSDKNKFLTEYVFVTVLYSFWFVLLVLLYCLLLFFVVLCIFLLFSTVFYWFLLFFVCIVCFLGSCMVLVCFSHVFSVWFCMFLHGLQISITWKTEMNKIGNQTWHQDFLYAPLANIRLWVGLRDESALTNQAHREQDDKKKFLTEYILLQFCIVLDCFACSFLLFSIVF